MNDQMVIPFGKYVFCTAGKFMRFQTDKAIKNVKVSAFNMSIREQILVWSWFHALLIMLSFQLLSVLLYRLFDLHLLFGRVNITNRNGQSLNVILTFKLQNTIWTSISYFIERFWIIFDIYYSNLCSVGQ